MNETLTTPTDRADERTDAHSSASSEREWSCPECDGPVRTADARGELACGDCGLVVAEDELDRGPEWRSVSGTDADERSRVGAPVTELLHDRGLSTTIGWADADAHGNPLAPEKRERVQRLRTWDERYRTKSAHERNLKQALGEVDRMASALGLPDPVRESAAVVYRRAVDDDLLPGRSIEAMATASLYAAAREHDAPRTLGAFASVSRVDELRIQRAYRYLSRELGLAIEPTDPVRYLRQYASDLGVSDEAEHLACDLLETAKREGAHCGKNPAGLAAAAVYAATRLTNERLTQATVSESTDVCAVTIRNRYQELLDVYGERGE